MFSQPQGLMARKGGWMGQGGGGARSCRNVIFLSHPIHLQIRFFFPGLGEGEPQPGLQPRPPLLSIVEEGELGGCGCVTSLACPPKASSGSTP